MTYELECEKECPTCGQVAIRDKEGHYRPLENESRPSGPSGGNWINVKERLPEGHVSVFASGINQNTGFQWREVVGSGWIQRNPHFITHWMPMPEVPPLATGG